LLEDFKSFLKCYLSDFKHLICIFKLRRAAISISMFNRVILLTQITSFSILQYIPGRNLEALRVIVLFSTKGILDGWSTHRSPIFSLGTCSKIRSGRGHSLASSTLSSLLLVSFSALLLLLSFYRQATIIHCSHCLARGTPRSIKIASTFYPA
jgi:hypothetical protein